MPKIFLILQLCRFGFHSAKSNAILFNPDPNREHFQEQPINSTLSARLISFNTKWRYCCLKHFLLLINSASLHKLLWCRGCWCVFFLQSILEVWDDLRSEAHNFSTELVQVIDGFLDVVFAEGVFNSSLEGVEKVGGGGFNIISSNELLKIQKSQLVKDWFQKKFSRKKCQLFNYFTN